MSTRPRSRWNLRAEPNTTAQFSSAIGSTLSGKTALSSTTEARYALIASSSHWERTRLVSAPVFQSASARAISFTDRYPGYVRHQLVELGYIKSAHSVSTDSVAFNVQPRQTGQLLIGSSRQFGAEHPQVDQPILRSMLARAAVYLPGIMRLKAIRVWTGFRASTPDKLPLIGPDTSDPSLLLATGHEGLGITTSLGTAELIADILTNQTSAIAREPYLPARYTLEHQDHTPEENHELEWSHAGLDDGI